MPLTGPDFEKLRDLVRSAFEQQPFVEFVRFRMGRNLYEEVDQSQPYNTILFSYIGTLEQEGLLTQFLQAVVKARPGRPDLLVGFRAIWSEVDAPAPSAQEVTGKVDTAVRAVTMRLPDDAVRQLVKESAQTLRRLSQDIGLLRCYKDLHDALHKLQMHILRRLSTSARRLVTDSASTMDLEECLAGIRVSIVDVGAAIEDLPSEPPALRLWEADWLERLRTVDKLVDDAMNRNLPMLGLQSAQLLRRILRHEPARIDRYLRVTTEGIDLKGLTTLFEKAEALSKDSPDAQHFSEGRQAAQLLSSRLQALVSQHSRWQEIDGQLWDADDYIPRSATADTGDFVVFWTSLREQMLSVLKTDSNPLADTLSKACDNIEALRLASEPDWGKITTAYGSFRNNAVVFFYRVDTDLKSLAGQVARIGSSLQSLVAGI